MRPEDILEAMGQISDSRIAEAEGLQKRVPPLMKWLSLAAILLCTVGLLALSAYNIFGHQGASLSGKEAARPSQIAEGPIPTADMSEPDAEEAETPAESPRPALESDHRPESTAEMATGLRLSLPTDVIHPDSTALTVKLENPTETCFRITNACALEVFQDGAWMPLPQETPDSTAVDIIYNEEQTLFEYDCGELICSLRGLGSPIPEGRYRIRLSSISFQMLPGAYRGDSPWVEDNAIEPLEFTVSEDGVVCADMIPAEVQSAPLPQLEYDWQWYSPEDCLASYRDRNAYPTNVQYGANGVMAVEYYTEEHVIQGTRGEKLRLDLFDRKTGSIYAVMDEPAVANEAVSTLEDGRFLVYMDDGRAWILELLEDKANRSIQLTPADQETIDRAQLLDLLRTTPIAGTELAEGLQIRLSEPVITTGTGTVEVVLENHSDLYATAQFELTLSRQRQEDQTWEQLETVGDGETVTLPPGDSVRWEIDTGALDQGYYLLIFDHMVWFGESPDSQITGTSLNLGFLVLDDPGYTAAKKLQMAVINGVEDPMAAGLSAVEEMGLVCLESRREITEETVSRLYDLADLADRGNPAGPVVIHYPVETGNPHFDLLWYDGTQYRYVFDVRYLGMPEFLGALGHLTVLTEEKQSQGDIRRDMVWYYAVLADQTFDSYEEYAEAAGSVPAATVFTGYRYAEELP